MATSTLKHSVSHKLFLELFPDKIAFSIVDKSGAIRQHESKSYIDADNLNEILSETTVFNQIYSAVYLVLNAAPFTVVPQSIEPAQRERLFSFVHPIRQGQAVNTDFIGTNIQVLFTENEKVITTLSNKYPEMKVHHTVPILHDALIKELSDKPNTLVVHATPDNATIMGFAQGKMTFANHFDLRGDEDVFYFTMLTMEELEFDPEYTELILLASGLSIDELTERFKNYIQTIRPMDTILSGERMKVEGNVNVISQALIKCV